MSIAKCEHGVYWPAGDKIALSCQACNPDGTGTGDAPVLPRSSSDLLNSDKTNRLEMCPQCFNVRTYFSPTCRACGFTFPPSDSARQQGAANAHQAGSCPTCGSTVHYQTKKKNRWQCADCDTEYPAGKRKGDESEG